MTESRDFSKVDLFVHRAPKILEGHAETVGQAIHIGKIAGDLVDVEDGSIRKSGGAQCHHIRFGHCTRREGQLLGIGQHSVFGGGDLGAPPIFFELTH